MTSAQPAPVPRPTGKAARDKRPNPTGQLFNLMFRAARQCKERLDELERTLTERVDDLESQVTHLRRDVHAARALYYDTHDSVTGEHIDGSWHRAPRGDDDRVT